MNKFMKVLMVTAVSVGMLSGCGDDRSALEKNTQGQIKKLAYELLTTTEKKFLQPTIEKWTYNRWDLLEKVYLLRSAAPEDSDVPFCDMVDYSEHLETKREWKGSFIEDAPIQAWERIHNETLRKSCEKVSNITTKNALTPTQVEVNSQIVADTVTLKDETLLSPEKIRELTNSVGTCNSAKVKLIMLTDTRKPLTISDYEVVTELIVGCEMDLLREELNK